MAKSKCREQRLQARHVRRSLAEITPANSHRQRQSPLWGTLPPEVRNQIFFLAVSDSPKHHYCQLQPHLTNRHGMLETNVSTSLLRTCRLAYYETHGIPLRTTTFVVARFHLAISFFAKFTRKNVQDLEHIVVDSRCLFHWCNADPLYYLPELPQCRPRILTVRCLNEFPILEKGTSDGSDYSLSNLRHRLERLVSRLPISVEQLRLDFDTTYAPRQEVDTSIESVSEGLRILSSWELHASQPLPRRLLRRQPSDNMDPETKFTPEPCMPDPKMLVGIEPRPWVHPYQWRPEIPLRVPIHWATVTWTRSPTPEDLNAGSVSNVSRSKVVESAAMVADADSERTS